MYDEPERSTKLNINKVTFISIGLAAYAHFSFSVTVLGTAN